MTVIKEMIALLITSLFALSVLTFDANSMDLLLSDLNLEQLSKFSA